jgi:hypothetical protein
MRRRSFPLSATLEDEADVAVENEATGLWS